MSTWRALLPLLFLARAAQAQTPLPYNPSEAERHYKSGVAQMRAESWEEAAEEFRTAASYDHDMVLAHYNLGQCRMYQKRYVEAVAAYKSSKEAVRHLSSLSQKERDAGEKARRDEIRGLRDDLTQLHTLKDGSADRRTAEIETRIALLESMQLRGADQQVIVPAELPLALGSAYFRQGRLDEAQQEYTEAIRANPKLGAAHNNLAVIHMLGGRLDQAEAEARLAEKNGFRVDPHFKDDLKKAQLAAGQKP